MLDVVAKAGLSDTVKVDSAGTGGWHVGELPDSRMRAAAKSRGYALTSRARQVQSSDLNQFDLNQFELNQFELNRFDLNQFDLNQF